MSQAGKLGKLGKLLHSFIETTVRYGCSPTNLLRIFKTPFHNYTSGKLLLKLTNLFFLYVRPGPKEALSLKLFYLLELVYLKYKRLTKSSRVFHLNITIRF